MLLGATGRTSVRVFFVTRQERPELPDQATFFENLSSVVEPLIDYRHHGGSSESAMDGKVNIGVQRAYRSGPGVPPRSDVMLRQHELQYLQYHLADTRPRLWSNRDRFTVVMRTPAALVHYCCYQQPPPPLLQLRLGAIGYREVGR